MLPLGSIDGHDLWLEKTQNYGQWSVWTDNVRIGSLDERYNETCVRVWGRWGEMHYVDNLSDALAIIVRDAFVCRHLNGEGEGKCFAGHVFRCELCNTLFCLTD